MYIQETTAKPAEAREGIWKEPWNNYWEGSLIFGGVVYDLGRHGNGAEAGIAYATALMAFREDAREASGNTGSSQPHEAGLDNSGAVGCAQRAGGLHDRCDQPDSLPLQSGNEVAR